jgi:DNA-binding MarR family transcriptional regulator
MSYLPVWGALTDKGPLSQKELAQIAGVEQPTMAETLERMERAKLIRRQPNPNDKRASLISLTRRGRARFPKAMALLLEGEREATMGLSAGELVLLRELLARVVGNLEARVARATKRQMR